MSDNELSASTDVLGPLFPVRGYFYPYETLRRETSKGTPYEAVKWMCQKCGKECSTLYVDDEWCHGDSVCISFVPGPPGTKPMNIPDEKCGDCWIKRHNVEFSGVPAGHSSNHPAGGTSAGTQG